MGRSGTEIEDEGFFTLVCSRGVVHSALKVGIIVGTLLAFINHGDKILAMSFSSEDLFKIALTYLVPYGVSSWSSVMAIRAHTRVID